MTCVCRRYTWHELDALRRAIEHRIFEDRNGSIDSRRLSELLEPQVRTAMMAGLTAEDVSMAGRREQAHA